MKQELNHVRDAGQHDSLLHQQNLPCNKGTPSRSRDPLLAFNWVIHSSALMYNSYTIYMNSHAQAEFIEMCYSIPT